MSPRTDGPHGLLLLDKPAGITSHDLVSRTRRALGTRKVGHAGTLDPMATGLMLVGVGDATRLLTYLVGEDKVYEATVRFGSTTTTEDAEGEVKCVADESALRAITYDRLEAALATQRGAINQVPSAVSAIKVDGVRSYRRVRDGEDVQLAPRPVTITELRVLGTEFHRGDAEAGATASLEVRLRVACSSGTYVRAIARDLGEELGVGAHLSALRRLEVGPYSVDDAADVADPDLASFLRSPGEVATRQFAVYEASEEVAAALRNGRKIEAPDEVAELVGPIAAIDTSGTLVGLFEVRDGVTKILMNMPQRQGDA
ncbi:tRNA pseudouridine(55) synthase TruB [Gulosibacter faecalis]|jgi:tRNA pseudouridine55 synthase|uniref:tRNA pseudouridine synthase B n=1 Tax=Gulosibacter faecalis TaxID=272240 RepID=A0ABW5UZT4_9MICO|nr:tRNA pseudouridine(55) synthase TruB [Gulosibacter faecalis]